MNRPLYVLTIGITTFSLLCVTCSVSFAATSGPALPWDTPLATIRDSLSGTVAHVLITVAIILMGIFFAFSEHGGGARALFGILFGGAVALGAISFMTALGWAGATF